LKQNELKYWLSWEGLRMHKRRVENWSAMANERARCPVEGCIHVGDIITKAHLRLEHGMTREQVEKQCGRPYRVIAKTGVMLEA
jgi:hypothetical protein